MHRSQLYFNQDCPVCGRGMRVRIELLGREVACGQCTAVVVASDEEDYRWVGVSHPKKTEHSKQTKPTQTRQFEFAGR